MHPNTPKLRRLVPMLLSALAVIVGTAVASGATFPADGTGTTVSFTISPGGRFGNLDGSLGAGVPGSPVAITTGSAVLPPTGGHALIYNYPDKGLAKAAVELVAYSVATSTSITITARGQGGTADIAHDAGSIVKAASLLTGM